MTRSTTEIQACLASLDEMLARARAFDGKLKAQEKGGPRVDWVKDGITFSEIRSLDLRCKDVLERALPDYPDLAEKWYVHDHKGFEDAEDIQHDLAMKKAHLRHALNLLAASAGHGPGIEMGSGPLPREYGKLTDSVKAFFQDTSLHTDVYDKNVFIMTRFQPGNNTLCSLDSAIRHTLNGQGLVGHRADDRCYASDRNLWDNVCTYMFGCKYGIAVLENIIHDEFNPNVALEFGFMRALGKPTLLLKEQRFKPRADILGTLWAEFDILDIGKTVPVAIKKWLDDLGIVNGGLTGA